MKQSKDEGSAQGVLVFTKVFIPEGATIGLRGCVCGMFIPPVAFSVLEAASGAFENATDFWDSFLWGHIEGHSWSDSFCGELSAGVDPGIVTFAEHGCDGTHNCGTPLNVTERILDHGQVPSVHFDDTHDICNPFDERHAPNWECGKFKVLQDIQPGEELLDNCLVFKSSEHIEDWEENL